MVIWPDGWSGRRDNTGLALLDATGELIAREGDEVELGGGYDADDHFRVCGDPGLVLLRHDDQGAAPPAVRDALRGDLPYLRRMVVEASIPPWVRPRPTPAEVLRDPVVGRYLLGWGRAGTPRSSPSEPMAGAWALPGTASSPPRAPGYGFVAGHPRAGHRRVPAPSRPWHRHHPPRRPSGTRHERRGWRR